MLKAIQIEETGRFLVKLPRGEYKINGEFLSLNQENEVELDLIDSICEVRKNNIIEKYENADGQIMSYADYQDARTKLESKGVKDEEYLQFDFENLDDEFAYRKFVKDWNPIYRTVVAISDPLPVEIAKVKTKTDNPFITSSFSNLEDPYIYYYDRLGASVAIVREVMAELGVEDCGHVDYSKTAKSKKWGNNHRGIRFVTAFGGYPFSDEWDFTKRTTMRGSLEDMVAKYNSDKEEISKILKSKYAACFGGFDESKVLAFANNFKNEIEWIYGKVTGMEVKQKNYEEKLFCLKKIRELINKFDGVLIDK